MIGRESLVVEGIVQGVGFRPFVYGLAQRLGLAGFVGNNSTGVFIEIEGEVATLARFKVELVNNAPPLAHIEAVRVTPLMVCGSPDFRIVESKSLSDTSTFISPDLSVCKDCLRELFDSDDRRYQYPFINCTNCGPRFTIIKDIPYDRPLTTLSSFKMCWECKVEYNDPLNRRFHAQPNACPNCGPQLTFQCSSGPLLQLEEVLTGKSGLAAAQSALRQGLIVAIKGLGGFHLACSATNSETVCKLRQRKGRQAKPFALMAKDLAAVQAFAEVNPEEAALLISRERPIVLLKKKPVNFLAQEIAPGNGYVGVMLPYTPLHYLLVEQTPLVMTSANFSGEPIVKDNEAALSQLAGLADAFVLHNRDIHIQCDDSVVRVFEGQELPLRRSRGYAPFPVKLPFAGPSTLAVGGELKSTFCLTKDNYAVISQHIGDMENLETLEVFSRTLEHMQRLFRITPQLVVSDTHPRYLSATWAEDFARQHKLPLLQVQHHQAHLGAVMAENGWPASNPLIGFSFDGTGYGSDGAIWGGETFIADYSQFRRVAHLKYIPLPGGDATVKKPYRTALAYLWAAGLPWDKDLSPVRTASETELRLLSRQLEKGLNTVLSSSMGRLFDAVAALTGVRQIASYEAQAAIEFEALAYSVTERAYEFDLMEESGRPEDWLFVPDKLLEAIITDLRQGVGLPLIAAKFHDAVAKLIIEVSIKLRQKTGLNTVALSGGVFQNLRLLKATVEQLRARDFTVLTHHKVPPNDGGLALGQAIIASQLYNSL